MVPAEVIWWAMARKGITYSFIDLVKDMYWDNENVRTCGGVRRVLLLHFDNTKDFPICPFLFMAFLDEGTRYTQDKILKVFAICA